MAESISLPQPKPSRLDNPWLRIPLILVSLALIGVVLLWSGGLDWVQGWIYLALVIASIASAGIILNRVNPEVLKWRRRIGKNTKRWDRPWLIGYRLLSLAVMIVGGLDAGRYAWTTMSVWLWPVGLCMFVFGYGLAFWAMAVNVHFEGTVRIQNDRHHRVIDSGPYAHVRHPGYVGIVLFTLGTPFLLGSWWAVLPALAMIPHVALRTWLEDRTLQRELDGYAEFARRTRYRLLPGVW
jgi:protein-S-isoprenylcysteine O-methyltransferase Ste14